MYIYIYVNRCELVPDAASYEFLERANVTNVHPDIVDYTKTTSVTIIGEGFKADSRTKV